MALRRFPFAENVDVLMSRLHHEEMLVRCHAVQTIMLVTGLKTDECAVPELAVRIMRDEPAGWGAVITELEDAIRNVGMPSIGYSS